MVFDEKINTIYYLHYYPETIADGIGLRASLYLSGCQHACFGCHNKESWSPKAGEPLTQEKWLAILDNITNNLLLDGVTITGGDPFFSPENLFILLQDIKKYTNQNIWCYTGFTYEQLREMDDPTIHACLEYIDVLVDGRFDISLFDPSLHFKGSSNQRIIRLKRGLAEKELLF